MAKIYLPNKEDITTLGGNIGPIVQSELDEVYAAVAAKGGTVPTEKTLGNLKAAVESIEDRVGRFISYGFADLYTDVTSIRPYCFYKSQTIGNVNAPNLISVGAYAFNESTVASFPFERIESAGDYSFCNCQMLTGSLNLARLVKVPYRMFSDCKNITEVLLPEATELPSIIFFSMQNLKRIYIPKVVNDNWGDLRGLNTLEEFDFGDRSASAVMQMFGRIISQTTAYFPTKNTVHINCADGYLTFNGTEWVLNAYE